MSSGPKRSLQTIRTMSNRFTGDDASHKKLFALTLMEHEKARLTQEKKTACRRVARIDRRIAEIQEEQARLLRTMEDFPPTRPHADAEPGRDDESPSPEEGGFRLKY